MDKDTCITNLRDLISPSNTDDENEALLIAIQSVRARETVQGVVRTDKNGDLQIELLRLQDECKKCEFNKFAQAFIDGVVETMNKHGIKDFDELAKQCGVSYLHQDSITKSDTKGGAE